MNSKHTALVLLLAIMLAAFFVVSAGAYTEPSIWSDEIDADPYFSADATRQITFTISTDTTLTDARVYFNIYPLTSQWLDPDTDIRIQWFDTSPTGWLMDDTWKDLPLFEDGSGGVEAYYGPPQGRTIEAGTTETHSFRVFFGEEAACSYAFYYSVESSDGATIYAEGVYEIFVNDIYEPDNSSTQATTVAAGSASELHALLTGPVQTGYETELDEDWFAFSVDDTDVIYRIETLAPDTLDYQAFAWTDTWLYLYAPDGETELAENDDYNDDVFSTVFYKFDQPGTYFARVVPFDEWSEGYYTFSVTTFTADMMIYGCVYDVDDNPVDSCYVEFYDEDWQPVARTQTAPSGYFEITLPAGSYYMFTDPHESSGLIDEYYDNTLSTSTADLINLTEFYFDEVDGMFYPDNEDGLVVYLADETHPPFTEIFSPEDNGVVGTDHFTAEFMVSDDSLKWAGIELYDSENNLVDAQYDCFTYCSEFNKVRDGEFSRRNLIRTPEFITPENVINNGTTSSVNFVELCDDTYTLLLTAEDETGNVTTDSVTFVVDANAPSVDVEGVNDGEWYNHEVTPVVVFDDLFLETTSVSLTRDGTAVAGWDSGMPVSDEGHYVLFASATDIAGHETTVQVEFYIDLTEPTVTITNPISGNSYAGNVTIDADYSADVDKVEVYVDDQMVGSAVPALFDSAVFADGEHTITVNVYDRAGNIGSDSIVITTDNNAPSVDVEGVNDGEWYNHEVTPVVVFDDLFLETTSVSLTRDGTAVAGWDSGMPVSDEGHYVLFASATDIAGHETTVQVEFYIDLTSPTIEFIGFEDGGWYNHDVTPCVVFEDNMMLDTTNAVVNGEYPVCVPYSNEGTYTVSGYAEDAAGNITTAVANFYIDLTEPTVTITNPISGNSYAGNVTIDADYSADVDEVEVYVDDQMVGSAVPALFDSAVFADGEHTITVNVYDRAGNIGSDSIVITTDNNAPVITCDIDDGSYLPADTVTPDIQIFDVTLESTFAWLNGDDGTEYEIGNPITGEGQHTLHVVASDSFGRVTHFMVTFTLDATPPEITITGVEDGTTYTVPVTPVFSATDENLSTVVATLNGDPFVSGSTITEDGTYTLSVEAVDLAGNMSTESVTFYLMIEENAERIMGESRIDTAIAVSQAAFEEDSVTTVVVATAYNFPDALAAAPLAHALGSPILLVPNNGVPQSVLDEINRLGATAAYVIGGPVALSDTVVDDLENAGLTTERIGGANRFDTAAQVAYKLAEVLGVSSFDKAYIATGMNFPDALAAGGVAAADGSPILLVMTDSIPAETQAALTSLGITRTYVIGGTAAVSDAVKSALPGAERIAGANRFETAVAIAEHAITELGFDASTIYVATGMNYPDALAAGAASAETMNPVILVNSNLPVPSSVVDFINVHPEIFDIKVLGGNMAVSDAVVSELENLIQ